MQEIIYYAKNEDGNIIKTTCILYSDVTGVIAKGYAFAGKKNIVENSEKNRERGKIIAVGRAYKALNRACNLYDKSKKIITAEFAPRITTEDGTYINQTLREV